MAHQSLYLRYRPARFAEIIGQGHVVAALRNAVASERVGHAYLFSGPRGTGKTSTARILAKALNCENPARGEPCGGCAACSAIAGGTSYELHELDAASNNKVDDVRDLISRVAIGTPGRVKVYVLDEVHMLTPGAENALLKTLEEPPPHVVFVLCTTEPHKVAQTIRSRTQHLHFELLAADLLESHVRAIAADAKLEVSEADVAYVLAAGGGSARDTLSALDAVVAAGRSPDGADLVAAVLDAVANEDTAAALSGADAAARAGREPHILGEALLSRLRSAFLASMEAPLEHLPATERSAASDLAGRMRPRALTWALELLGQALVAMREAPDPRVDLDLALVQLTNPKIGLTLQSLAERVERLEQHDSGDRSAGTPRPAAAGTRPPPSANSASPPARPRRPGDEARANIARAKRPEPSAASRSEQTAQPPSPPAASRVEQGGSEPAPAAAPPEREEAVLAWVADVLPSLRTLSSVPKSAVARLANGRFLPNAPGALRLAFQTPGSLQGCEKFRSQVEAAFGRCFDRPVAVEFALDDRSKPDSTPDPPAVGAASAALRSPYLGEVTTLSRARPVRQENQGGVAQLQKAFPGSRLVELEAS